MMKKWLILSVLSLCGVSAIAMGTDRREQNAVQISREEALVIALDSFSLTRKEIDHWDVELDRERKTLVYEVELKFGNREADLVIDASTGDILRSKLDFD